jgi:signal transduction histidine kinase
MVSVVARLAMDNERLRAELLVQLEDLRASQVRIVEAGDAERRRIERNVHDGAQQQLVALSLNLALARPLFDGLANVVGEADRELRLAIEEMRELAHGIYPAALADEGLAAAVDAIRERSAVPVNVGDLPDSRFHPAVETGAYFLIAEGVRVLSTSPAASGITVTAEGCGNCIVVEVTADREANSHEQLQESLIDVADRIGALGGHMRVSQVGCVAVIRAEIPCGW